MILFSYTKANVSIKLKNSFGVILYELLSGKEYMCHYAFHHQMEEAIVAGGMFTSVFIWIYR
tara:strand:+ start:60 stop:245 length:186 start_codon:yes stop_codon:yes gene_type:complete